MTPGGHLPRHIVWDWNGTLQDDVLAAVNGINALLRPRGLPLVDVEKHRETFGFPVRNYYIALGFKLELENWDAMAVEFHRHFLNDPTTRLRPEAPSVLSSFKKAGIGMSLLSAAETETLEKLLTGYGIRGYFDNVRGLDNLSAKSKLEIGRGLVDEMGIPPEDICFIGDTDHDWEVADALGAKCVLLTDGYQSGRRLAACGCPLIPDLAHAVDYFGLI